ncbi:hypothetical protein B0T26DRAFT_690399 [Lasiosphaeria miniovina]|uniref:Uncharacterized protein n=1 Tax=Lasiosphaeria miniovina TaxID=1954250 RepID=A0AA40BIT6_9PEZI|nr:uncharacterized protein B0T26DRAFT_690399 [Lasiosphaeria miniovina]KAK0735001.1 hypothetical protein B0T26DRAFT_690399 [Lasiosphaeria miniovina]
MLHERERRNPIQWWNQHRARLSRCMAAAATLSNDRVAAMIFPSLSWWVSYSYMRGVWPTEAVPWGREQWKTDR